MLKKSPAFYWRPFNGGETYEGPIRATSVGAQFIISMSEDGSWKPLYEEDEGHQAAPIYTKLFTVDVSPDMVAKAAGKAPKAFSDEQLADMVPAGANVFESQGLRMVAMTRAQLHEFAAEVVRQVKEA